MKIQSTVPVPRYLIFYGFCTPRYLKTEVFSRIIKTAPYSDNICKLFLLALHKNTWLKTHLFVGYLVQDKVLTHF